MNIDGTTTLLAAGAAACFVAGGMILRWAREVASPALLPAPSDFPRPAPTGVVAPEEPAEPVDTRPREDLSVTRPPYPHEEATSDAILRVEVEHAATRDRLGQVEIELAQSKAEVTRLSDDLDTKQSVMQQMGNWLDEERVKLKAAQEQIQKLEGDKEAAAKDSAAKEPTIKEAPSPGPPGVGPRIPRPESMRPPDAAAFATLRGEVAELRKKLDQSGRERETAEAKVKALETLVEAVRARSRELAHQVAQAHEEGSKHETSEGTEGSDGSAGA